jgi:hypothetical protein
MYKLFVLILTLGFTSQTNQQPGQPQPPPMSSTTPAASTTTTTTTATVATSTAPPITNWIQSTGGKWNGSYTDVTKIYYDNNYVYITANSLPDYMIGIGNGSNIWNANPNYAKGQGYTFKITRNPSSATTKSYIQMGLIGFWKNGVGIYNAEDGYSYQSSTGSVSTSGDGSWNRNAAMIEVVSFDSCYGHPDENEVYHVHLNPICMYNSTNSASHSPIIGWAWDGYPIYGPFGYSSANNSASSIKRMMTGYSLRNITTRTTYWNGTTPTHAGPAVSSTYYLGYFVEDYGYSSTGADLDQYQGRWCVTPDYPSGTYAYFIPTTSSGTYTYPYTLAPFYYGTPGSESTSISIPSSANKYFSYP